MKIKSKAKVLSQADDKIKKLLKDSGSNDIRVALAAQRELAVSIMLPIRQGILDGDIVGPWGIFTPTTFEAGQQIEYPLDFLVPGTESEYAAYTLPNYGRIPERNIEGDYVVVPTYDVGASIDWALKFSRDARWDVFTRAMQVLENMFVRKINSDAWRLIIATAVDRNLIVSDSNAPSGFFTKRLISLMKISMRRSGGGNLASIGQKKLTDVFLSPEGVEDIRTWDLTQIDDVTRREVFLASDDEGSLRGFFGVNFHPLDELGENQSFQQYYTSLGGTLTGDDVELAIGLDLSDNAGETFVMPIRQQLEIFEDEALHRQRRAGYYGWQEHGLAILDNRSTIIGSY
jgi:hypothetical protein